MKYPIPVGIFLRASTTADHLTTEVLPLLSVATALLVDGLLEMLGPARGRSVKQRWAAEARRRLDDVRSGRVRPILGNEALA